MKKPQDACRLCSAIEDLGISQAAFALLADRSKVMMNSYCTGRKMIPEWIWLVAESAKKMSAHALEKKIMALRKAAKK